MHNTSAALLQESFPSFKDGGQCRSISYTTSYRGAKPPPGQLRPDISAWVPRLPEGQGNQPAGLRCTQRLRAHRSRSCAAARTKVRGRHPEHPQSPWAPVLPHTFKRRRKFENSQPPSSFLLLSRLPPRLTHLGCSLLPSPPPPLLPPTRHSLEDRPIAASPDAVIVGLAQHCRPEQEWTVGHSCRPWSARGQQQQPAGR